jgi:mono/diheme cytochrome c family protein
MKSLIFCCATVIVFSSVPAKGGATEGKVVYDKSCKICHGAVGQGNPAMAKVLKVEIRHLGSKEVQAKSDAEIKTAFTVGTAKKKPVAGLAAKDVDNVVAFVRTLKQ